MKNQLFCAFKIFFFNFLTKKFHLKFKIKISTLKINNFPFEKNASVSKLRTTIATNRYKKNPTKNN